MKWRTYIVAGLSCLFCATAMTLLSACMSQRPAEGTAVWQSTGSQTIVRPGGANGGSTIAGQEASGAARSIPGALPSPDEELWIIAKDEKASTQEAGKDFPGAGALMAKVPGKQEDVPVSLKHTDVKADIRGYIATVDVTQQYHNPFSEKIEAVYLFPLPHNAAVSEFVMTIGSRHIRGIVRDRAEAEAMYREAKAQGYVASLLTQERPNIFTQSVANIEPGRDIDIHIRYFHTLAYADGWYEFHFPVVIGPRYNPAGSGDGVGAVGRHDAGASGQKTEVQYLKPTERNGHDISLAVALDAGTSIEKLDVPSHVVTSQHPSESRFDVKLSENDTIPNRDFVLRYKVAGKQIKPALIAQRNPRDPAGGGYFALMLYPPESLADLPRQSLEFVFVIDSSGSMTGYPIEKVKSAVRRGLRRLEKDDTFQVINFSNEARQLGDRPVPATRDNIERALAYVDGLAAGGGTEMMTGLKASLDLPHDPTRLRVVAFLTDGYIGNEAQILGEINQRIGQSRIFSFGVGTSVNRYLIEHMAKIGRGAVAYVGAGDSPEQIIDTYFDRISHPAMTDISVDWGELRSSGIHPNPLPDLFVGRAVTVVGRFNGNVTSTTIHIKGKANGQNQDIAVPVSLADAPAGNNSLASVWARTQIADLADAAAGRPNAETDGEIKRIALQYGLMSPFTAFIAVDATTRTAGDHATTVVVPVPVPEGVRYETTVNPTTKAHRGDAEDAEKE